MAFPSVTFLCTENTELARAEHVSAYPTMCFYEKGMEFATLIGSGHLLGLRKMLEYWTQE